MRFRDVVARFLALLSGGTAVYCAGTNDSGRDPTLRAAHMGLVTLEGNN